MSFWLSSNLCFLHVPQLLPGPDIVELDTHTFISGAGFGGSDSLSSLDLNPSEQEPCLKSFDTSKLSTVLWAEVPVKCGLPRWHWWQRITLSTQETRVQSLDQEDPLEEGMATHSSILAWRTPWTEEPGGLQSIGSQRVWYNWSNLAHTEM